MNSNPQNTGCQWHDSLPKTAIGLLCSSCCLHDQDNRVQIKKASKHSTTSCSVCPDLASNHCQPPLVGEVRIHYDKRQEYSCVDGVDLVVYWPTSLLICFPFLFFFTFLPTLHLISAFSKKQQQQFQRSSRINFYLAHRFYNISL